MSTDTDNLHVLPTPPLRLPEGWEPSSMFTDTWIRKVSTVRGLPPDEAVYDVHGPDAVVLLTVECMETVERGTLYRAAANHLPAGVGTSLAEACAEAERLYCGCHVRSGP